MKKLTILLLINLLIPILSFSQTIYPKIAEDSTIVISPIQLKQTNLIFSEHSKLLLENNIYQSQIINYKNLVTNYQRIDSINNEKIDIYYMKIQEQSNVITNLNKKLNISKTKHHIKNYVITGLSILGLILLL